VPALSSRPETVDVEDQIAEAMDAEAKPSAFLVTVPINSFSPEIARRCARLRLDLMQQEKQVRLRALDLTTAATALEYGLTLVTRITSDYQDIPGMTLY
jgi:predicted nucleic acid-binding protein